MTPKEKAKELVDKMEKDFQYFASREIAKQHALIAVDEVINNDVGYNAYDGVTDSDIWIDKEYWQEVKQEIHKL